MSSPPEVRKQLQSLTIPKDQKPDVARATSQPLRRGRTVGWFVLIFLTGLLGYGGWQRFVKVGEGSSGETASSESVREFFTVKMVSAPMSTPLFTATGKIVSDHQVQVVTKVSGQVVALFFEQGDHVEANQLLARIEDVLYRARRDESTARLRRAGANLDFQEINYQRVVTLVERNSAPPIELANAKRALRESTAQVAAEQAALDFAQKSLNDCKVVAPIAGVILERNVEVGDFVAAEGGLGANANARFAIIADMETLRVEVDISELDIARITKGLRCTVTPDAYDDRLYQGYVLWIDPGANYSKATVQVKVRIERPDPYLRVQGSAKVNFLANDRESKNQEHKPALWIPRTACVIDPASKHGTVFVREGRRLRETKVTLGRTTQTHIEIIAGLTVDQSITATNVAQLVDGQRIDP